VLDYILAEDRVRIGGPWLSTNLCVNALQASIVLGERFSEPQKMLNDRVVRVSDCQPKRETRGGTVRILGFVTRLIILVNGSCSSPSVA